MSPHVLTVYVVDKKHQLGKTDYRQGCKLGRQGNRVRGGKNRHSCLSSSGDVRWEFVCQHGKGEFRAEISERLCLTSLDFDRKLFLGMEDTEKENAKHPHPLEKFTGLVQRLAIIVLPDPRSVCFVCAERTTSPEVQQLSLEDAQEKKKITDFFIGNHYSDANDHLSMVTMSKML